MSEQPYSSEKLEEMGIKPEEIGIKVPEQVDKESRSVQLTEQELDRFSSADLNNPDDLKFLEDKGIKPDSGPLEVRVGDRNIVFTTDKNDFGTRIEHADEPGRLQEVEEIKQKHREFLARERELPSDEKSAD